MNDKKVIYQKFHAKNNLPIFCSPCWLDITCGKANWNVVISQNGDSVFAVMPYYVHKTAAGIELIQPKLSKFLGIYFEYPKGQSSYKKYSFEKQHTQILIDQLPKFGSFKQSFYYNYQNWLPLYWNGFKQTTNYSYSLPTNRSLDEIFSGFKSSIRRSIRKAEKDIECTKGENADTFFGLAEDTFKRQGKSVPYSKKLLEQLVIAARKNNNGELIIAKNQSGTPLAGGFFVWDKERLYYLTGGVNSNESDSGAMSLVMWNGIQLAHQLGVTFDFEGSMVESIEHFFRSFGSEQTAYFQISKVPSKILQLKYFIKSLLK